MYLKELFNFRSDISGLEIPSALNNPFSDYVPEIAKLAAKEFQEFISKDSLNWKYDLRTRKGKMFGVLVVQTQKGVYKYLGTISGMYPEDANKHNFVPSVFDVSADNYFINTGMTEVTKIGNEIKKATDPGEIASLREKRRQKSIGLQRQLFENYNFINQSGEEMNLLDIFENSSNGLPPSASGDCAAPKLIQFAIKQSLKPIAVAEFWWGKPNNQMTREHLAFYPACKDKCRPILEYLLEDNTLYDTRIVSED